MVQPGDYLCMSVIESFKASVSWICSMENLKNMCELAYIFLKYLWEKGF